MLLRSMMSVIFVLAAAPDALGQSSADAAYVFALDAAAPSVTVSLRFQGDADGSTFVGVAPEWGGVTGHGKELHDVAAQAGDGRDLRIERDGDTRWRIEHDAGEPIVVRYALRPTQDRAPKPPNNDYRTRIEPGLFQMIGQIGLIMPLWEDGGEKRVFSIEWQGFDEAGWKVASSLGPGSQPRSIRISADDFRQSVFVAGDIRVVTRDVRGKQIGVAIHGSDWGFDDDRFADLVQKIVALERDFFNDHDDEWFLVTLTPEGRARPGGLSMGGTGLTNAFSLFCNTGLDLADGSNHFTRIVLLLAHEYFHTWNGGKIRVGGPEGSAYWFSEGFTDFYARRLLLRAGMISTEQFAAEHNESISRYQLSSARNAPNQRVIDEFWKDRDVGQLPYAKGNLIAIAVDERIRAVSAGKRSLDDVMLQLHSDAAAGRNPADVHALIDIIRRETDDEFGISLRSVIIDGKDVPLPPAMTEPPLKLTPTIKQTFDAGFDTRATAEQKLMTGVRENSAAWKAGLRDGQKILAMSITSGGPDSPPTASVEIEENGASRTIEYDPLSEPAAVHTYVVKEYRDASR